MASCFAIIARLGRQFANRILSDVLRIWGSLAAGLDSGRADEVGGEVVGGEGFDIHFHE